jgi:hypothetical protein
MDEAKENGAETVCVVLSNGNLSVLHGGDIIRALGLLAGANHHLNSVALGYSKTGPAEGQ